MPQIRQDEAGTPPVAARSLALIAAMAKHRIIGRENRMPWHIGADLKRFRTLTMGHRVIMGRRTFESLGKPLAGRENVVVSRTPGFTAPGCRVVPSLSDALADPPPLTPMFCVGGAQLYAAAMPLAGEIYLTEIDAEFPGDTAMPDIPVDEWREDAREEGADPQSGVRYAFVHFTRIASPHLEIDGAHPK